MVLQPYKSTFTRAFLRQYRKLPDPAKERIKKAILEITTNPHLGLKLRGALEGYRRWRVGDYRVIYLIEEAKKQVVLIDVGPRKTIYD